jgi:phosphatidylserine/phosphatidylglycerophosphate/cardiolipin synthase-like enzyme
MARLLLPATLLIATVVLGRVPVAAAELEVHYAPVENLERIDVGLLRSARTSIDMAAFILTDRAVIDAVRDAVRRGVKVRVLLDGTQLGDAERLAGISEVVRVKERTPIMHLKAYTIDGTLHRTGSANFSASGLKQQDNDLVLTRDAVVLRQFDERFEAMYARAGTLRAP